jgi:selenocysteine-specific elongation factor
MSLIDVPGHERFVKTMIAGATGIDLFLLVLDAAEGARPQTHEHLAVLRLLGVDRGVVAVTKADAVDEETLELAIAEAEELVPGAEVVAVSAKTGRGLDELRAALARVEVPERTDDWPTRLYVDRVFTLKGIGTVATGTLWSGSIGAGDVLRLEPKGREVRIRSVQVHDEPVDRAESGQRVAVNLAGVERVEVDRGDALVEPGWFPVSYRLDVRLDELDDVPAAVTVHLGTSAVPARVARRGAYAQLRLAEPVVAVRGDRLVLRSETTVAGAAVLDPLPPRGLDEARLAVLEDGDPQKIVRALVHAPVSIAALEARGLLPPAQLAEAVRAATPAGDYLYAESWLAGLRESIASRLTAHAAANPLDPGLPIAELLPEEPWTPHVLDRLELDRRDGRLYPPGTAAALGDRAEAAAELEARLVQEGIVKLDDRSLGTFLEQQGALRLVGNGYAVSTELYERGRALLAELPEITIASCRDALGVGRRTAQLLLERYDGDGLTRRVGDKRVLRRARD